MASKTVISNLGEALEKALKNADEIWVATALINEKGLSFIQQNIKKSCQQRYIIGVDLPTHPNVLDKLGIQEKANDLIEARVLTQRGKYFHPKVYIIRKGEKHSAFVGSGNTTNGGLFKNYEMSILLSDTDECLKLLKWYRGIRNEAGEISEKFVADYRIRYEKRKELAKKEKNLSKKINVDYGKDYDDILKRRDALIEFLRAYKASEFYEEHFESRMLAVENLKETVDYPNFKKIDIDAFLAIGHLGQIRYGHVKKLRANTKGLRRLFRRLTDESVDISVRFDDAIEGDYKVFGAAKNIVTKILAIHKPELYFVDNNVSNQALEEYELDLESRTLSVGQKYKIKCRYLQKIMKEADIPDFTILDCALLKIAEDTE